MVKDCRNLATNIAESLRQLFVAQRQGSPEACFFFCFFFFAKGGAPRLLFGQWMLLI